MQRLGTATGITQQFLLLCGMSADCSRKDLLQALLWPYMQRKGIRRRFLANADWTAPILGDQALPAFRFGCMPQASTSTTSPAGLEVVLATDVVWLIISQGLFAAEWAVTAHGHSVVVHLRNLASATLALLGVLIHTKIEKAAIPANNGHLVLSHPSPVMRDGHAPAAVPFDERLHTDSFRLDNSRSNANMLCYQMRRHPAQFRCIQLADKSTVLYYESMLRCREATWLPQCVGELFPFPPESTYHMHAHQQMMSRAYQRFLAEQRREGCRREQAADDGASAVPSSQPPPGVTACAKCARVESSSWRNSRSDSDLVLCAGCFGKEVRALTPTDRVPMPSPRAINHRR